MKSKKTVHQLALDKTKENDTFVITFEGEDRVPFTGKELVEKLQKSSSLKEENDRSSFKDVLPKAFDDWFDSLHNSGRVNRIVVRFNAPEILILIMRKSLEYDASLEDDLSRFELKINRKMRELDLQIVRVAGIILPGNISEESLQAF